jgi:hypothetical protein
MSQDLTGWVKPAMTTVEREAHQAEMRRAADELAFDTIVEWVGPFSYWDIAIAVTAGLYDLGYSTADQASTGAFHWSRAMVRDLVAEGDLVEVRAYAPPSKPKLFQQRWLATTEEDR